MTRIKVIMSMLLLSVCATVFAQSNITVSISRNKVPLSTILSDIERQTGYLFVYNAKDINAKRTVSMEVKNQPLETALGTILTQHGISYTVDGHNIVLKPAATQEKEVPLKLVTGTVTGSDQEPVIGASIRQVGSKTNAASTDIDGNFSISVPEGSEIEINYVGCKSQIVKIGSNTSDLVINLKDDNELLEEVVVVGYGTMKRKEMTSAISHISAKDLNQVATTDASMLLQGKVSSVNIDNTNVGNPNQSGSIQVRGVSSRSASLGPLVVVDGVPGEDITAINPNDVESIDVLKDGAASAIYGTRGSNGVILINLKKGARDGNVHTSYSGSMTVLMPKHELDFLTAEQWRWFRCKNSPDYDLGGSTDWFDAVTRTAIQHMHTVSVSGGTGRSNYRASVDYRNAEGVQRATDREEYGARVNLNHTTSGGLMFFSVNVAPRIIKNHNPGNLLNSAIQQNPTMPIFDSSSPDGYYQPIPGSGWTNERENADIIYRHAETKRVSWDATAGIDFFSFLEAPNAGWLFKTQLTFSQQHWDVADGQYQPSTHTYQVQGGTTGYASRSWRRGHEDNLEWVTNLAGNFLDNHHFRVMLGYSYNYGNGEGMNASNFNFDNDGLLDNNLGQGIGAGEEGKINMGSWKNDHKLIGFFGRVNYDWKERYLISASIRREGSSRFGANHKWGNFPAVSVGWRISDESFMEEISWLDDLKLRYDYGVTGNQEIGNYNSLPTYSSYGWYSYMNEIFHVWGPGRNPNSELRWEKAHNMNFGIDFSLFNSRIHGSLNYFNRRQSDLLGNYDVSVPPNIHTSIYTNVGTMRNTGVEFDLTLIPVQTRDFNWSFTVIGATNNNKFENFSNDVFKGQTYYPTCSMANPGNPGYLQRIEEGQRVGNFFTFRYAGISDDGNWLIYNKNGEVIPVAQGLEEDKAITGNGLPKFTGSMTHNFTWRDFDLSFTLRGAAGFQLFNVQEFYCGLPKMTTNVLQLAYTKNAALTQADNVLSDYFIENGDYLKIEDITIGYNKQVNRKFFKSLRAYASFRNLYTFTKFSGPDPTSYSVNGLTPGTGSGMFYLPQVFQFNFGLQLHF